MATMISLAGLRARLHGSRVFYVRLCKFLVTLPVLRRVFRPPAGLISLLQGPGSSRECFAAAGISVSQWIYESEIISLKPARFAIGRHVADKLHTTQYIANARSVVTVSGGMYRNASGYHEAVVLDRANRMIQELSPDVNKPPLHRIYEDLSYGPELKVSGRLVCLTTPGARTNYFLWLTQLIPKLSLLAESGQVFPGPCHFVLNSSSSAYQDETLGLLGIARSDLILASPGMRLRADDLVVPTHASHHEAIPKWAVDFLADSFITPKHLPFGSSCTSKKIFVHRPSSPRRKMSNLDDVCGLLARRGYVSVDPGSLSFLQQVSLFRNADVIVAEHGAALANLVFCRSGTRLLEIFSPYWATNSYRVLSHHKHIVYGCLSGLPSSSRAVLDRLKISAGYHLPLQLLEASLELLEEEYAGSSP